MAGNYQGWLQSRRVTVCFIINNITARDLKQVFGISPFAQKEHPHRASSGDVLSFVKLPARVVAAIPVITSIATTA